MLSQQCFSTTDNAMTNVSLQKGSSRKRNSSFLKPTAPGLLRSWSGVGMKPQDEKDNSSTCNALDSVYSEMAKFAVEHEIFPIALSAVVKENEDILNSNLSDPLNFILSRFVDIFRSFLKRKKMENSVINDECGKFSNLESVFHCHICKNIINDPVTIGCGHSFCRACISRNHDNMCSVCDVPTFHDIDAIKSNILLTKCIESCFVNNRTINKLKEEGNAAMKRECFQIAIEKYSKALQLGSDHILLSNRSYAFLRLNDFERALSDANEVIKLRPEWPKGYYRRGAALLARGVLDEAATSLCQCLRIDPNIDIAKDDLKKCLAQIFSEISSFAQLGLLAEHCSGLFRSACSTLLSNLTYVSFKEILTSGSNDHLATLLTTGLQNHGPLKKSGSSHSLMDSVFHVSDTDRDKVVGKISDNSSFGLKPAISVDDVRMESRKSTNAHFNDQKLIRSLNKDDFECSLCLRLFYDPVTTKCGHSYCRQCLERCLDHKPMCPLCKEPLTQFFAGRQTSITQAFHLIMRMCWPQEYLQRKQTHDEEMDEIAKAGSDQRHEMPIFLCTLAYPNLPCPLHIFEPRYRLMVRRCMEAGTRQFGITINSESSEIPFIDIGTILEIRHIEYLPDGRSILDTRGGKRFRVLERSMRDGYHTAKVEFIRDEPVSPAKVTELNQMCEKLRVMVDRWFQSLPESMRFEIERHYGSLPAHEESSVSSEQGPAWLWWLTAVLPVDTRIQVSLISSTSLENRLNALHKVLTICLTKRKTSI